jgi:putative FmdB family regulatory protein
MPIYEYRCDSCGEELEKLQRMSDDKLVDCPACGEPALKRLVSAAAFRLKGSGWYETDFKKDNKRNLHDSSTGSASKESEAKKSADSSTQKTEKTSSTGSDKKTSTESTAKAGKSNAA